MADEILTGSGGGQNILAAKLASRLALLLLADRASLRNHPALLDMSPAGLLGSTTTQHTIFGLDGYDEMAAVAEGASIPNTALTTSKFDLTPARQGIAREFTDEMRTLDQTGQINPQRLAMSAVGAAMMRLTSLLAAAGASFTNVKGTSGAKFTHDLFMKGKRHFQENSVGGPFLSVVSGKSFSDWIEDLELRGGMTQWAPANAQMQMLRGPGFKGTYDNVDVFVSSKTNKRNSNADYANLMFGRGALAFKELPVIVGQSAFVLLRAGPVLVEEERTSRKGLTGVIGQYHAAASIAEDTRGVILQASV